MRRAVPCWIGEDPDVGYCDACNAYHLDRGTIRGVDVSGLSFVAVVHIPGNVLQGNWRVVWFISEEASDEQFSAIRDRFGGKLGGPLADLAQLFGEILAVERAPIRYETVAGKGVLIVGDFVSSEMAPYMGTDGLPSPPSSIFSTVPGSPAYVAKAAHKTVNLPQYSMVWSLEGRNAIQGDWKILHAEAK